MSYKLNAKTLLFLLILIALWMSFTTLALGQPIAVDNDLICERVSDAQEIVRRLKDYEILKELDKMKDQRIANLEKELELVKREAELKDRIIAIKDMEIQAQARAIQDLKDISDRAIKLAETSKPKALGNWELIGIIGVIAFIAGLAVGL